MARSTGARGAALITGASSGIGEATARRMLGAGFRVYATARDPLRLGELEGLGATALALDVTDQSTMRAAVEAVEAEAGHVSVLVNNAGYSLSGPLEELPLEALRDQLETNVVGVLALTQLALPGMRRAGAGRVILMGSMGGKVTFPGGGAYHMTKYALEAMADALRFEVVPFGVDVSLIEPGPVRTRFAAGVEAARPPSAPDSAYAAFNDDLTRLMASAYRPGARGVLSPDDVAEVVVEAATARRPKPRYRVGAFAAAAHIAHALLPDRGWDAAMRRMFAAG